MARIQLLATSAAIDWRAYSASSRADSYCVLPAALAERARPQRSSSQPAKSPTPLKPVLSPPNLPPPRASKLTVG